MFDGGSQPFLKPAVAPHWRSIYGCSNIRPITDSAHQSLDLFWRFSGWRLRRRIGSAFNAHVPVDDGGNHDFVVGRAVLGEVGHALGDFSGEDGDVHGVVKFSRLILVRQFWKWMPVGCWLDSLSVWLIRKPEVCGPVYISPEGYNPVVIHSPIDCDDALCIHRQFIRNTMPLRTSRVSQRLVGVFVFRFGVHIISVAP